ncbi:MAG: tetratricopeptide repeat protein, partial [Acidobacteria bacterium]|nr:tetratricopeptide repeat protein [Acidobacteriota bacterium]
FGFHHYQKGEYDEALQWYRRGLEIRQEIFGSNHSSSAWNLYDQACLLALSGDGDGAIATLHRALDIGWANHRIFEDDDFDSLKANPKFETILAEVRSRL